MLNNIDLVNCRVHETMPKRREYEKSHPWLTFKHDFQRASPRLWANLCAIQSKCKHVADTLLPSDKSAELYAVYLAKGVQATTAIEGNTMTEEEVRNVIHKGAKLPESRDYQAREVQNILEACNSIASRILRAGGAVDLTVEQILTFNRQVLDGLQLEDGIIPGQISDAMVVVAGYRGAPRADCEYLLGRLCEMINASNQSPDNGMRVAHAVIRAVLAHLYLAWIHPFGDGNGRTARLIELQILIGSGVPDIAAHLLSNHYNSTRARYYQELDRASKSRDGVASFVAYAVQGMLDQLDEQIKFINGYQWHSTWKDHVYTKFKQRRGVTAQRQRQIALDLWQFGPKGRAVLKIRRMTPEIAESYAGRTERAVSRDLAVLASMGLIEQIADGRVCVHMHSLMENLPSARQADGK